MFENWPFGALVFGNEMFNWQWNIPYKLLLGLYTLKSFSEKENSTDTVVVISIQHQT